MKGVANSILITLIVAFIVVTFTNSIAFFPWYLSLIYETFNLSIRAANDNFITAEVENEIMSNLRSKPIFKDTGIPISISGAKTYQKRGKPFSVGITSEFPFKISITGGSSGQVALIDKRINIGFNLKTTGINYDKEEEDKP